MIDERFARALHVESLRRGELHAGSEPHVLFQASTIGALLEGAFDGDVTFRELAEHGDLGLGTLNGLDGEMIAVDGSFYRAGLDGDVAEIDPDAATPFAVVVPFEPSLDFALTAPLTHDELLTEIDRAAPAGRACALRLDGDFTLVRARSVPRQTPPYRPLTEVVADQHVYEFHGVSGTVVGMRFPDHAGGIEASGYHLHFIDADRRRGGHVLDLASSAVRVRIDPSSELRVELPPGVDLSEPHLDMPAADALRRVEGDG